MPLFSEHFPGFFRLPVHCFCRSLKIAKGMNPSGRMSEAVTTYTGLVVQLLEIGALTKTKHVAWHVPNIQRFFIGKRQPHHVA